jgi:hypothetical protein
LDRATRAKKWAAHPVRGRPRGGKRRASPREALKRRDRRVPTLEALRERDNPTFPALDDTRARRLADLTILPTTPWIQPELEDEFLKLAATWREETEHLSSTTVFTHAAYQRIIGLGPKVVPAILRDLARTGDHWFWALRAITGQNPVRPEDAGNVRKMAETWLAWGEAQGLV